MFKPKHKFIKDSWILRNIMSKNIRAITLAPFGIYYRDQDAMDTERTKNHESIHWQQQLELLLIFFYVLYLFEWIVKIFFYGKRSYMNLSSEREAYDNDDNLKYLETRKRYTWLKEVFK